MMQQTVEFLFEGRISPGLVISPLQFLERRHQDFGDEASTVRAIMTQSIRHDRRGHIGRKAVRSERFLRSEWSPGLEALRARAIGCRQKSHRNTVTSIGYQHPQRHPASAQGCSVTVVVARTACVVASTKTNTIPLVTQSPVGADPDDRPCANSVPVALMTWTST